ncbi:MAG: hypothetical protein F4103_03035 [Boseongicola sp. SB0673_bin_14]|nr:hypothetical protein [Boseongicola sp. SB0667_bin_21]MYI67759.1 hypothetical protein [Boseongicola sp. SB0673_bin_14]
MGTRDDPPVTAMQMLSPDDPSDGHVAAPLSSNVGMIGASPWKHESLQALTVSQFPDRPTGFSRT